MVFSSVRQCFITHPITLKAFKSPSGGLLLLKTVLYECRYVKFLEHYVLLGFNVYGCQIGTTKCKFLSGVYTAKNAFQDTYASLKPVLNHF